MRLAGTEAVLAKTMFSMITAELGPPPNPEAAKQLEGLCNGIANALIPHLISMAQVAPGIVTAGGPAAQATTTPGVLI